MRIFFSLIFLIFFAGNISAQTTISGKVMDSQAKLLNGATVMIKKDSSSAILAYGISGKEGRFSIKVNSEADSLLVKTSYIGFSSREQMISNSSQELEVILKASSEELKEVLVEAKMLDQRGDTLSFSVAAYKGKEDRVIADVLKKIPGIEILPGGQIRYQGEPIQKYYIEGLDMLEGRYNLANENMNANAVSKVEILENHQPIKVLDSLEFSERASLNIKLKKDVTLTGSAEIGAGLSPFLWQVKATPMIFTEKRQALVTYQSNNTGKDLFREIRDFSFDLNTRNFNMEPDQLLFIAKIPEPSFATERWLDNNAHLASLNFLEKLGNDFELKANISYLNDSQLQQGRQNTRFFTPIDTIDLREVTRNRFFINDWKSKLTLEKNTDDRFLKNQLEMNASWNSARGLINRDSTNVDQDLEIPFQAIRNNFQMLSPVGKQLVNFRSVIGYSESQQELEVKPGQFPEILNQNLDYETTYQDLQRTELFTDNSAGFNKGLGNFSLSPKIGFQYARERLNSELSGGLETENENFRNDLEYRDTELYFDNSVRYKSDDESWNLRLTTDLALKNLIAGSSFGRNDRELQKLVFEPSLFATKKLSAFWETTLSAGLNYEFGGINRLYQGLILTNYRQLQTYDSPISEDRNENYRFSLNYRNPLKQFFVNASYRFMNTKSNLLYSSLITENGTSLIQALERDNYTQTHSLGLEISQYFLKLNTTFKLSGNYRVTNREQILNQELSNLQNRTYSASLNLDSEITDWFSANYKAEISFFETYINTSKFQNINAGNHFLNLYFFPADNQYLNIGAELYDNSVSMTSENYFINLKYNYQFEKAGLDLSLNWNNILDTDSFSNVYTSEYSYVETSYVLRPSQFLLSLKFSF
ncbi:hypothetical protein E0K83_03175 [Gramella sp. BOM4]|nr:hypothetical protein [Christiangramia bathymodioli]